MRARGTLIVFSGRSGVGKSTIARALVRDLDGLWLRIDSIEQAIRDAGVLKDGVDAAGYLVAQAVAADNLELGRVVVADCVNDWTISRDAWRDIGLRQGSRILEVEVVCSDEQEARRRVETRVSEIPGLRLPDWQQVISRDYHPWNREHVLIDTAGRTIEACVRQIFERVVSDLPESSPSAENRLAGRSKGA